MSDTSRTSAIPAPDAALPTAVQSTTTRKRDRAFRRSLLDKLPALPNTRWDSADTLNVFDEITSIVELDSDTFLEPLERVAGGGQ